MNDWISVFLGGRKMVLSLGGQGTPCPYMVHRVQAGRTRHALSLQSFFHFFVLKKGLFQEKVVFLEIN